MEQIGTVEILKTRVYALDDAVAHDAAATTVVVEPGTFPLYLDGISYFWMLTGRINTGRSRRLGDGIFSMSSFDEAGGPEVTFPSKTFGPDEWDEFTAEPTCTEGHPEQRLRISLRETTT
jgi:hypothetical protein